MSSSPFTFLDFPPELKCRIMQHLDVRSLLRLSLTSKSIYEVIYASDLLVVKFDIFKSDLFPVLDTSTQMARKFLNAHLDARLNMPIATRLCVTFPAPDNGIRRERLFRGHFVCITEDHVLHAWSLHSPDPTKPPPKFIMSRVPDLIDVLIEPDYNLMVLLCYNPDQDSATIRLLDLRSRRAQPYPFTASPLIIHNPLPDDDIDCYPGQQLLTLRGRLLALVYSTGNKASRRGIIWDWRTGQSVYDSMDFESSSNFHDLLLLPTDDYFLVTVSTFLVDNPADSFLGAWIELRYSDSLPTTRLVAQFELPAFGNPAEHCLGALDFHSSEPPNFQRDNVCTEDTFPFVSNLITSVHVLHIWYTPRLEVMADHNGNGSRVYLVINNMAFGHALAEWLRQDGGPISGIQFPMRKTWGEWGPWWTMMLGYDDLGLLSGTSSVCGSRICTVTNPEDDVIELLIVDFNSKISCGQWNCTEPLDHFYPTTLYPINSPWGEIVRTWLPFHTHRKRFEVPREDGKQLMCVSVLMDEERIVFATCADDPDEPEVFVNPTSWKVVYLVREPTALGDNCFMPAPVDEEMDAGVRLHDRICRMCKEKPHTDAHILLECTAEPKVVDLRQTHLVHYDLGHYSGRSFDELFKELMARRDTTRMPLSVLAEKIRLIYIHFPKCSELIPGDQENPVSILFTTQQ